MTKILQKTRSLDLSKDKLGYVKYLQCLNCGEIYTLKRLKEEQGTCQINVCYGKCLGPLVVSFDLLKVKLTKEEILSRQKTFSALRELLPYEDSTSVFDFNFTDLRYSKYYSEKTGLEVYFKLDMDLPSGSFKDRPVLAAFKRARETGYNKVFVASTGNLAIASLKLGKLFNFDVKVYLSNTLNKKRRAYIERFCDDSKKQIVTVDGSYDDANIHAIQDCELENNKDLEKLGQYKTFVPNYSFRPYYKEGSKTSGFEIAIQLLEKNIPENKKVHIFYPVGSGALICSAYKGIQELKSIGVFKNKTSFYAIQQETLNPVVRAFNENKNLLPQKPSGHLVREIAIGNPGSGIETLKILKDTNGAAWDVSDKEILKSFIELYKNENLFPQLCGAMTIRGFEKLHKKDNFTPGDIVVLNITGNGRGRIEDDLLSYGIKLGLEKEIKGII